VKTESTKWAALVVMLMVVAIFKAFGQAGNQSKTPPMTTNWLGSLVIGAEERLDTIAGRGPFPVCDRSVELGLRSDGVVVWRRSVK